MFTPRPRALLHNKEEEGGKWDRIGGGGGGEEGSPSSVHLSFDRRESDPRCALPHPDLSAHRTDPVGRKTEEENLSCYRRTYLLRKPAAAVQGRDGGRKKVFSQLDSVAAAIALGTPTWEREST